MNVGKDPFPRDEVTGLAAFEDLEPVGSLSIVPDESCETPIMTHGSRASDIGTSHAGYETGGQRSACRERPDTTLPLDLTAMPRWEGDDEHAAQPQQAGQAPSGPGGPGGSGGSGGSGRPGSLDALFGEVSGPDLDGDWDDDAATRVHSHPAGNGHRATNGLAMDWDEDEPPTEMRPFAMFDGPPLAARHDWPEWNSVDEDETSTYQPKDASSIRSATPTIRTSTPPVDMTPSAAQRSVPAFTGGRPSPFPAAPVSSPPTPVLAQATAERAEPAAQDHGDLEEVVGQIPMGAGAPSGQDLGSNVQPGSGALLRSPPAFRSTISERLDLPLSPPTPARFLEALKAGHRGSLILAAVPVVGLLALLLIVRAITGGPLVGDAVVEVSPADAKVQVDGKAVLGSASPYSVPDLAPGKHDLVATKSGFSEYHGQFVVNAGRSTELPVIELSPVPREIGFSVRSIPQGAAVWIDGAATDEVTPARVTGIKPGIHRLQLKHAGYTDYELQMFVPEGTVLQLPAAELIALPASADAEPAQAARRWRSRSSASAQDSESASDGSRRHSWRSHSSGNAQDSESASGGSRRHSWRSRSSGSAQNSESASEGRSRSHGWRSRSRSAADDDSSAARSPATSSPGKMGTLRLNTRPWSQVLVDGRVVGNTPQPNLQLSAGKHKLQLINQQLALSKRITVTIKPGKTLTRVINLAE